MSVAQPGRPASSGGSGDAGGPGGSAGSGGPASSGDSGGSRGPGGAAAPARQRIAAQARFEALTLLRNGEQLLVSVLLPAAALVGLAAASVPSLGTGRRIDLAVPGVLALAVISTAFTGQAIATGFDRRYGVLRLFGTSPLGRDGLLAGKAVAILVVQALQWLVIGVLGLALGWEPTWQGLPAALVSVLLGTWAFVALALLLAGTVRAEGVLAVANLVWVALLGVGGVIVPAGELSAGWGGVVALLPSSALADALRGALTEGAARPLDWLLLLAWAGVATLLGARLFRWDD